MPAISSLTKQEEEREATFAYDDLKKASTPDLKRPFSSVRDACERLLPYHVWAEWDSEELDYSGETDFSPLLAEKWEAWADAVHTRSLSFKAQTERLVESYDRLLKRRVIGEMAGEHLVQNAQLLLQDEKAKLSDLKLQLAQKEKAEREREEARKLWETVQQAQRLVDAAKTQKQEASGAGDEVGEVERQNLEIVNHVIGEVGGKNVEGREVYLLDKVEQNGSPSSQQDKQVLNERTPGEDKGIDKRMLLVVRGEGEREAKGEEREKINARIPQDCQLSEDESLSHGDGPQEIQGQGRAEEREEREEDEFEEDGAEQEWAEDANTLREEGEQMQGSEDEVVEEELLEEEVEERVEEGWDGEDDQASEDQDGEEGDQREGPEMEGEEEEEGEGAEAEEDEEDEEGEGAEGEEDEDDAEGEEAEGEEAGGEEDAGEEPEGEEEEEEAEGEEAEGEEAEGEEDSRGEAEGEGEGEAGGDGEAREDEDEEEGVEREDDYGVQDDVEGMESDDQQEGWMSD